MKVRKICFVLAVLMLASAFAAGCGQSAAEPAVSPAAAVETTPSPEPTAQAEEEKKELPPPPDIDIDSWEYLYAGVVCGVSRYHPNVRNIESQMLDSRVTSAAQAFLDAARAEGYKVWIGVGYRNFEYTSYWFADAMNDYGGSYEAAQVDYIFPAGCTEHSTGLAIDITDEFDLAANYYNMHDETVKDTEVYKWMAEHCAEYGFIVRYPEGKEDYYVKACYPGHFRYVGVEAAEYIMENDLCFEEFLNLYPEKKLHVTFGPEA